MIVLNRAVIWQPQRHQCLQGQAADPVEAAVVTIHGCWVSQRASARVCSLSRLVGVGLEMSWNEKIKDEERTRQDGVGRAWLPTI